MKHFKIELTTWKMQFLNSGMLHAKKTFMLILKIPSLKGSAITQDREFRPQKWTLKNINPDTTSPRHTTQGKILLQTIRLEKIAFRPSHSSRISEKLPRGKEWKSK